MEKNYQAERVFNAVANNPQFKKHLGLDKHKDLLRKIITEGGYKTDPTKGPEYIKKDFLKKLDRYEFKRELRLASKDLMIDKKPETKKLDPRKVFDEVLDKKRTFAPNNLNENISGQKKSGLLNIFKTSNNNVRNSENIIAKTDNNGDNEVRSALDRIRAK